MKRKKSLWTARTDAALPESAESKRVTIPEPKTVQVEVHQLAVDRRAAAMFWKMYKFQLARADANARAYHNSETKLRQVEETFKKFKMRTLAKKLKASPLDRPAKKGVGL